MKNIKILLVCVFSLPFVACTQMAKEKNKDKLVYKIQDTTQLKASYDQFKKSYNTKKTDLSDYLSDDFILEVIRPISDHREIKSLYEVKKNGIRESLFGEKIEEIGIGMLKPWVLTKFRTTVNGKHVTDVALINISDGKIKKIVSIWSFEHHNAFFNSNISKPSKNSIKKSLKYMSDGYNKRDLKSAYKVIPDYIVFLKMNPEGVRDISRTGQQRKKFLADRLKENELWDSIEKVEFIVPPYSIQHSHLVRDGEVLTERIVLRRFDDGKLTFTINFVGAEEHRIHLEEDFYIDNPLYNYQYLRRQ